MSILQTWQRLFYAFGSLFFVFLIYRNWTSDSIFPSKSEGSSGLSQNKYPFEGQGYISVPMDVVMSGEPHALAQDDPKIISYIWDHEYIQKGSSEPYNLEKPDEDPSMGQGQFIRKVFQNKTGGFFVEAGALDGETRSNTLFLEKQLGWSGLIVEADPKTYGILRGKHRRAWTSNTCLATKPYPHKVVFRQAFNMGKISDKLAKDFEQDTAKSQVVAQCFPIVSLLSALQVSVVDYFSLDVEGFEFHVLENIPFDKIFFKTISVEFKHVPRGKEALKEFMEGKGYISLGEVTHPGDLANDFIFIHKSLYSTISTIGR